ncbi:MAG: hypothetical protein O2960_25135 [Verrucomicrobia bacterium]|nr:hypothetical protein [Verrucomicrobiota bacterium]
MIDFLEEPNQRIEPMTRSAITPPFQSDALGALLVMAHPDRSVSLTFFMDFKGITRGNLLRRSESAFLGKPTFNGTDWTTRSASKIAGNGITPGESGSPGWRISSPPNLIRDWIPERTR